MELGLGVEVDKVEMGAFNFLVFYHFAHYPVGFPKRYLNVIQRRVHISNTQLLIDHSAKVNQIFTFTLTGTEVIHVLLIL